MTSKKPTTPAGEPRKTGRRSKLTPEVRDRIVQAIAAGNYLDVSARYAGIAPGTLHRWMAEAEMDGASDTLREFRDAVESARAQAELRNVALIQQAAQGGTWQAAAWFLERSHPQRWGRFTRTEVTGRAGGPVEIDVAGLEAKIAEVLGEGGSGDGAVGGLSP